MRTPQQSAVQTQEHFWQLLHSSPPPPFSGEEKRHFPWYCTAGPHLCFNCVHISSFHGWNWLAVHQNLCPTESTCLRVSLPSSQEQTNQWPEKWKGKDISSSSDTFPQRSISETGLDLTIPLVAPLANAGTALMKCCACTHNTQGTVIASCDVCSQQYLSGTWCTRSQINTLMFNGLRNDISRNYPPNIWYLQQYLKQLDNVF